jgi:hypothetical protein
MLVSKKIKLEVTPSDARTLEFIIVLSGYPLLQVWEERKLPAGRKVFSFSAMSIFLKCR